LKRLKETLSIHNIDQKDDFILFAFNCISSVLEVIYWLILFYFILFYLLFLSHFFKKKKSMKRNNFVALKNSVSNKNFFYYLIFKQRFFLSFFFSFLFSFLFYSPKNQLKFFILGKSYWIKRQFVEIIFINLSINHQIFTFRNWWTKIYFELSSKFSFFFLFSLIDWFLLIYFLF